MFCAVVWGMISDHIFGGRRKIVLVLIGAITTFTTLSMILFTENTPDWLLYTNVAMLGFSVVGRHGVTLAFIAELAGTEMARAQCGTIRLKLLKIGARVRVSVRRIWVAMSESWPHRDLLLDAWRRLRSA